jgi:iron complex outermembrane receptor protein
MGFAAGKAALILVAWLAAGGTRPGHAEEVQLASNTLKSLSLEELMNVEVTTVSREPQPLFSAPSAIQVISNDEIRRSGATSLPEALRLAPNLAVAQIDSRQWAISSRGFNSTTANKLLVMIDGRTVYTPLFAGVFWDVQDTLLEDVERIEVVSGPGATLWGANAVNGIINVVTKNAKETQGGFLEAGGGTFYQDFAGARYGFELGKDLYARVYMKYFDRESTMVPSGREATNDWRFGQTGFRIDWLPASGEVLTIQADGYGGNIEQPVPTDTSVNGNNIMARWTHPLGQDSDISAQLYWDRTYRDIPGTFKEDLNTYDFDFQHRFSMGQRNGILWGAGYRLMADRVGNSPALSFLPASRNLQLFSTFAQDTIAIIPEKLQFTVGTKLEHNDFSGWEVEPSGRLTWFVDEKQTVWGAISRAVRSPSRIDTDFYVPTPPAPPGQIAVAGGPNFDSEKLIAYELGYKIRPVDRLSLSISTFYNNYDDIRSTQFAPGSSNVILVANGLQGESWGAEFAATYQVTSMWRLRGGYTYFHKNIFTKPGATDFNKGIAEGNDPESQVVAQSMLDLPWHLQLDAVLRYVDRLPNPRVPSYVSGDLRLAWTPVQNLELSIVGQNLFDNQHPEFGISATRQEIPRAVYGKVTWRF